MAAKSHLACKGRARLFKRSDRPSRFWQAAFRIPGRTRPIVKSTRLVNLKQAKTWAEEMWPYLLSAASSDQTESGRARLDGWIAKDFAPTIRGAKRQVERLIALQLLEAFEREPYLSQRDLARRLNISLGVANSYTTHCLDHGWLYRAKAPGKKHRFQYLVTRTGQAQKDALATHYIRSSLAFHRHLQQEFERIASICKKRRWTRIGLLGKSELTALALQALSDRGLRCLGTLAAEAVQPQDVRKSAPPAWFSSCHAFVITDLETRSRSRDRLAQQLGKSRVFVPELT